MFLISSNIFSKIVFTLEPAYSWDIFCRIRSRNFRWFFETGDAAESYESDSEYYPVLIELATQSGVFGVLLFDERSWS